MASPKKKKEPRDPEMVTRNALARIAGTALSNVQRYFNEPDAPTLDGDGRVKREIGLAFIQAKQQRAEFGVTEKTKTLKERKLELELEELERAAALRKGDLIKKADMVETLTKLMVEHFSLVKQKFVQELPRLYQGKNEVERRQMNESAYNAIVSAFRDGQTKVENKLGQPV